MLINFYFKNLKFFFVSNFIAISYVLVCLAPVLLVLFVTCILDSNFASLDKPIQNLHLKEISFFCFLTMLSGFLIANLLRKNKVFIKVTHMIFRSNLQFNYAQNILILSGIFFSAYGLINSFEKFIFEFGYQYSGAKTAWLGYGAWGVTLNILTLIFFSGRFISTSKSSSFMIGIFIIYLPILLCGTRIDFFSISLSFIAFICYFEKKYLKLMLFLFFVVLVSKYVSLFRIQDFYYIRNFPTFNADNGRNFISLSTFGDIGLSLFQIIHLSHANFHEPIGFKALIENFSERLLPGPFFPERPGDLGYIYGVNIGGGAINILADSYVFFGFFGFFYAGIIIGFLGSLAQAAYGAFKLNKNFISLFIFLFLWMIIPKGAWYQVFSIFKSVEVLLFIFSLLFIMNITKK